MLLAASTQRTIGLVILAIVFIGGLVYIYFNIRSARDEIGSEIELAANRRRYMDDDELETKRLDLALGTSLVLLTITAVTLPLYWLGEPGRHEGRDVDTARIFTNRGEDIYVEGAQCVACHGSEGSGGAVSTAITTEDGGFLAQVSWKAPALNTLLSRFTENEVIHTLNFGRNGVMPAWGGGGGGPLTDQQLDEIVYYIRSIQIDEDQISREVATGIRQGVETKLRAESDTDWAIELRAVNDDKDATAWDVTLASREIFGFDCTEQTDDARCVADNDAAQALLAAETEHADALDSAVTAWLSDVDAVRQSAWDTALAANSSLDSEGNEDKWRFAALELLSTPGEVEGQELYLEYGEILFTNTAAAGTYSCARCHTYGWSFDATGPYSLELQGTDDPILDNYTQGGGFFGPNLRGGTTLEQFESAASHADFITKGQTMGATYGRGGSGGVGQMPGFGPNTDSSPIGPTIANGDEFSYPALLTDEQIDAIVAFERNL
jgi:mono/diheme cytochrome c family protein